MIRIRFPGCIPEKSGLESVVAILVQDEAARDGFVKFSLTAGGVGDYSGGLIVSHG